MQATAPKTESNKPGRYLAIGDLHGWLNALITLEALVPFEPADVIITLGDYVDRGPDSRGVVEWLINRHAQGNLVALRGNHELMMIEARDEPDARRNWLFCGGDAALASYDLTGGPGSFADVPASHWEFLEKKTVDWHEIDTHFFVHANASPDCPLQDQPEYMLFWEFFDRPTPHESGKTMVCGHTTQRSGVPRNLGHAVCIDTWAHGDGWLTCLDVKTGRYWQANQMGDFRSDWLE